MTTRIIARWVMLIVSVVTITACSSDLSGPDGPVPTGTWASADAIVTVTANGAHIEFPCASGDITQPLILDAKGNFAADGVYVKEVGAARDSQAAHFSGHVDNQTMTLSVTAASSNQSLGTFTVKFGAPGIFAKCV
jgi:hypothetical protein